MSHHPPTLKKQKLVHLDDDDGDHPHSVEPRATHHDDDTAIVAATTTHSAVTALALCSETIVFSGHRDGRICRWNLTTTDHHTSNNENHNNPEWTITSACVNLTQHEQYGTEAKLGIAGLAVRRPNPSVTTTAASPTQNYLLYSWNHQREDMRLAINGIPQKVMIWNATTSERLSALMIDVGRCRETNMYANPLISCLVFCPLLVPDGSEVPVWTDAVLVALQATCSDAPPSDAAAATKDAPTTTTTTALPKVTNHTPTGNIVPFHEATRKRMVPWIATGGFVRALAVVTNHNTGCVVSVTETTRPHPPSSSSSTTNEPSVVAAAAADHQTKEESTTRVPTSGGGTTTSITIWDTARPGTILHVLALDHPSGSIGGTHLPSFGSVCALTLSQCQRYLHLSMMVEDVTASTDRQHVVLRLTPPPTATCPSSTDPPDDNNDIISICGWYTTTTSTSHRGCIVASHVGDWIVTASSPTRNQVDHINAVSDNCLTWYSFHDLISSLDRRTTHDTALDITTLLPALSVITLPTAADTEPTALVLGPSHAIIGYEDGTVQMTSRGPRVDPLTTESTMEQRVSCSTAPIGLRGVPCPRLSSDANDVNLQNKCIVS